MNKQSEEKSLYDIMEDVADQIYDVSAQVCREICKYSEMYEADENDEKLNEMCEKCPLSRLF